MFHFRSDSITRFYVLVVFAFIGIAIFIVANAWVTMFVDREFWNKVKERHIQDNIPLQPERGRILDENGGLIVSSLPYYRLRIDFKYVNNDNLKDSEVTPNHPMSNFMVKLLSGKQEVTDADCAHFSLENHITKDAPPVFLAATAEDGLSPYGALLVANCYSKLGLGYELHMFQHGPHGYSLADATTADGSNQVLNSSFAHWHSLSVDWLYRIFGQPTFTDHSTSRMGKIMAEMGLIPGSGADHA